jgi:hypothetical protein
MQQEVRMYETIAEFEVREAAMRKQAAAVRARLAKLLDRPKRN